MSGSRKLGTEEDQELAEDESQEVYLRDGRKLVTRPQGADQLVEIRSPSGMVELRIVLTEQGPVLQMEAVRLELKAEESVAIESRKVEIKGTESVAVRSDTDVEVEAQGDVRVVGAKIYLN
jgi:hypothetical protein